jgi:hypothetical protein
MVMMVKSSTAARHGAISARRSDDGYEGGDLVNRDREVKVKQRPAPGWLDKPGAGLEGLSNY